MLVTATRSKVQGCPQPLNKRRPRALSMVPTTAFTTTTQSTVQAVCSPEQAPSESFERGTNHSLHDNHPEHGSGCLQP
jgi:hypothetical protein